MNNDQMQRTPEWYAARAERFTSSAIYKLRPSRGSMRTTKTAMRYIREKVAEILTAGECIDTDDSTKSMRWGTAMENEAREAYEQYANTEVMPVGFVPYGQRAGSSPDGLVGEDGVIEIKCPYESAIHVENLMLATPQDVKRERNEYYFQMQMHLLATGRSWCDFVSYDPRICNAILRISVVRIPRDEEFIAELEELITEASDILNEELNKLYEKIRQHLR